MHIYNACGGRQLLGMRPSDPRVVKFVREMEDRKRAIERGGKTWTTEKYDDGRKVMPQRKLLHAWIIVLIVKQHLVQIG